MRNALGFDRELSCLWLWVVENLGPNNWFTVFLEYEHEKIYSFICCIVFLSLC